MLGLLEILQTGGTHRVGALAAGLRVDERTVRRYVEHLADLGVPVEGVRGRYGGYRLAAGYRMPPLMFTDAEAVATVVGLVAGQRTGVVTEAAESAAAKVRRVLPRALADRLDALLETLAVTAGPAARATQSPETGTLLAVAQAARDRRPLVIAYAGRGERTLHPYGVVAHSGRWYVTGADSASGEVRTFRLDRIERTAPGTGTFEVPEGFDPAARVLTSLAEVPYHYEVSVRVQATGPVLGRQLPPGLAVVEDLPHDAGARVRLRAQRLDWVPALLASLDAPFVVETPAELRGHLRALARRLELAAADP